MAPLPMRSGAKSSSVACDSAFWTPSMKRNTFRDHHGKLLLKGAMGVPELKRVPDGSLVELQRSISNLVPMNAYFRRLWGDFWSSAFDLLFWTEATFLKLIRRTWSLFSTCFACLQPGRASSPLRNKSPAQCTAVVTLTNGSTWLSPLFARAGSAQWTSCNVLLDAGCST